MSNNFYSGFVSTNMVFNGTIDPGGLVFFRLNCYDVFSSEVVWTDKNIPSDLQNAKWGDIVFNKNYSNTYSWRIRLKADFDFCDNNSVFYLRFLPILCGNDANSDHNGQYCPDKSCDCCPNVNAACDVCQGHGVCNQLFVASTADRVLDYEYQTDFNVPPMIFGCCINNFTLNGGGCSARNVIITITFLIRATPTSGPGPQPPGPQPPGPQPPGPSPGSSSSLTYIIIIVVVIVLLLFFGIGGYFLYKYYTKKK